MAIHTLERTQFIARSRDEVFEFFSNAGNLQAITPPFLDFQILTPQTVEMKRGTVLNYRLRWHFLPIRWQTLIVEWTPPQRFVDVQVRGPYKLWRHSHSFEIADGGTRMTDSLSYELPLGFLGEFAHALKVRRDVEGIFDYRREKIQEIFGA